MRWLAGGEGGQAHGRMTSQNVSDAVHPRRSEGARSAAPRRFCLAACAAASLTRCIADCELFLCR